MDPVNPSQNPAKPTAIATGSKKTGAKGKYTPKKVEEICRYIQMGLTNATACRLARISEATYYEWIKSHPEFSEALTEAIDKGEAVNLDYIRKARNRNWMAAKWLLEVRFPERYALVKRHELSGPGGRPVPIAVASVDLTKIMSIEQLEKLAVVLDTLKELPDEPNATDGDTTQV